MCSENGMGQRCLLWSHPPVSPWLPVVTRGYLGGALHDERGELAHHQVHTLEAGLSQFEDLLFDHGLEGHVGGEEARSERAWWGGVRVKWSGGGSREQEGRRERERDRERETG